MRATGPIGPIDPGPGDALVVAVPVIVTVGFVLVGLAFIVAIGLTVHRAARLRSQGVNPLTLQEDLATRALRSQALAPSRSKAERLDELDAAHAAGRISDGEHAAARSRVLAE